jgi:HD-GYP domain-containing protein (c-di-GMP phosphodiesterase class II)
MQKEAKRLSEVVAGIKQVVFPSLYGLRSVMLLVCAVVALSSLTAWVLGVQEVRSVKLAWEETLQRISKTHATRMNEWMGQQHSTLSHVADNPSVQLYFVQANKNGTPADVQAQKQYISNLLTLTSSNLGLQTSGNTAAQEFSGGVAVLANDATVVATSRGMLAMDDAMLNNVRNTPRGTSRWFPVEKLKNGEFRTALVVPVYGVQMDAAPETQVGYVLSMIPLNKTFFAQIAANTTLPQGVTVEVSHEPAVTNSAVLQARESVYLAPFAIEARVDREVALGPVLQQRNLMVVCAALAASLLGAAIYMGWTKWRSIEPSQASQNVTRMLGELIDQRDPLASQHSYMVSVLSKAIAKRMGLPARVCETTAIAASLVNLGKAKIPGELLTRSAALNPHEIVTIRNSLIESAEVLEGLKFPGPVVEILKQTQEHVSGAGPKGLKGDRIQIASRIIAVANSFVAMTSPRAYRSAMSVSQAMQVLAKESGTRFDAQVVRVLNEYTQQHGMSDLFLHRGQAPEYVSAI